VVVENRDLHADVEIECSHVLVCYARLVYQQSRDKPSDDDERINQVAQFGRDIQARVADMPHERSVITGGGARLSH
jgi:hypothetical protein